MHNRYPNIFFSLLFCLVFIPFLKAQDADFYQVDSIQEIKIEFEQDNWRILLDSLRFNGDELLEGTVTINGTTFENAGVRIKGDRAFIPDQKKNSLFILLDYKKEGQNYLGNRAVMLSMALRDPSMVREVLAYEIAGKYMPAPKANFAKVQVNEEYYGLFVNIEPIDAPFLERAFGDASGHLYYSNPTGKVKMNDFCLDAAYGNLLAEPDAKCYDRNFDLVRGTSFNPLIDMVKALNSDRPELRSKVLDTDKTLWMLALNNTIANLSSYLGKEAPNYFLYQQSDGRFAPIIWNMNFAFGSVKNIGKGGDLSVDEMEKLDLLLHKGEVTKPLVHQLLISDYNQKRYLSHIRTLLYEEFLSGAFEARAKELQEMIQVALVNDRNRDYTSTEYEKSLVATIGQITQIPGLLTFMNNRGRYLKKTQELLFLPPEIGEPSAKKRKRYSREEIEDFQIQVSVSEFTSNVMLYYRFEEDQAFQAVEMKDDGAHYDEEVGDHIYGVIIPPKGGAEKIEFYIVAQNARTLVYAPVRYMYEQFSFSLSELNK